MKYHLFKIIIVLLFSLFFISITRASSIPEMSFLLEKFIPDASSKLPFIDWYTESENPLIAWEEDGMHTIPEDKNRYDEQRNGKIFLTANGKTYYTLRARKTIVPWDIEMRGFIQGVYEVRIAPGNDAFGRISSGAEFDFIETIEKNKNLKVEYICSKTDFIDRENYYILSAPNKKDTVITFEISSGSGGNSSALTLYYNLKPEDISKIVPDCKYLKAQNRRDRKGTY